MGRNRVAFKLRLAEQIKKVNEQERDHKSLNMLGKQTWKKPPRGNRFQTVLSVTEERAQSPTLPHSTK